jgi:hypothetical protein
MSLKKMEDMERKKSLSFKILNNSFSIAGSSKREIFSESKQALGEMKTYDWL